MDSSAKARLVGINHIALEVDDVEAAQEFYRRIFDFTLRGRHDGMAFIELGCGACDDVCPVDAIKWDETAG